MGEELTLKLLVDDDESSVEEWVPQHTQVTEESTLITLAADEEPLQFEDE